ncbi:MAG: tetratricopeptide repeat protein, partial [Bacteroidota bacterium]
MMDEITLSRLLDEARSYFDEGKYLHAIQVYLRITGQDPSVEMAWIQLSHVYHELRRDDAAEEALIRALEVTDDREEILFLLGSLLLKGGKYSRALTYYKQVLLSEPALSLTSRFHLHFNIGLTYFYRGNMRLAEIHFRRARRLDPGFPKINESLGELLLRRGAVSEAVVVLRRAVQVDPYSWIAHY